MCARFQSQSLLKGGGGARGEDILCRNISEGWGLRQCYSGVIVSEYQDKDTL